MVENKFRLEAWEGSEYIITVNGKPIGGTVTKANGSIILKWLKESTRELIKNLETSKEQL